jgi:hypothetical protein
MVKNHGGKQAKKQGRKHVQAAEERSKERTRLKKEDVAGEVYMAVTRMLGGSVCEVVDGGGHVYHCIIRSKFKGRHKRENYITVGNWVLVGLREWQSETNGKPPKCDLLEVYNQSNDAAYIMQNHARLVEGLPTCAFDSARGKGEAGEDAVEFMDMEERCEVRRQAAAASGSYLDESLLHSSDDSDFDIDEI